MMAGDFDGRNIDRNGRAPCADIDAGNGSAGGRDRVGQEGEFLALGIGGAHHNRYASSRFLGLRRVRYSRPPLFD